MKKSSIILISAIGLLIIVAFFMPFILLKKDPKPNRVFTLDRTGQTVEIPLSGSFYEFNAKLHDDYYRLDREDYSRDLHLEIIESDTISQPKLLADKSWASNLSVSEQDSTLYLGIDMKSFNPNTYTSSTIFVPRDNELVARLILPKAYGLNSLSSDQFDVKLIDLTDLSIEISRYTEFSLSNCQVTSLNRTR